MFDEGKAVLRKLVDGDRGLYIYGSLVSGEGPEMILNEPASGTRFGTLREGSTTQLDTAVSSARLAFSESSWSKDGGHRSAVLRKLADLVEAKSEVIAYLDAVEAGKVFSGSVKEDVPDVVSNLRYFADLLAGDDGRFLQDESGWGWVQKVPVGVVGVVLPWNFPIAMLGWKVAPALAAGNALVLKPAEDSTLSALYFAELATQAGVPAGILNVVAGAGPSMGKQMGLHSDIDVLTFTGSGPVGRSFLESSARSNLKKVSLELGGRAAYVIDSIFASDQKRIAEDVAGAAFGQSGQNCTATSRIIVVGDESEFERFRAELLKATSNLVMGDPLSKETDIGPVINSRARDRIVASIEEAVSAGARVVNETAAVPNDGYWVPPTVLVDVPSSCKIGNEEIFGPVAQLIRVDSREQAAGAINNEDYGLASTVWCEDLATAKWWTESIRVGTLALNGYSEGTVATPFGGMRESGFWGRDNGPEALDTYQESMTVWIAKG